MLIDSHCHLDRLKLKPNDSIEFALDRAAQRGVSRFICISIDPDNVNQVLEIANQHDKVWASVGVHPGSVLLESQEPNLETLLQWAAHPKVVAIGETGLDYYYTEDVPSRPVQQQRFIHHIHAGIRLNKPLVVHTRAAREDTIDLLKQERADQCGGVLHCFTESWEMAEAALDLGFYISISGIVTFKNAAELREVAKKVPVDRILIETDSPYLTPVPYRGKSNEPQYVREVAEFIAGLRGVSLEFFAEQTTKNCQRLFQLDSI